MVEIGKNISLYEFHKIFIKECKKHMLKGCNPLCPFYVEMDYPGVLDCYINSGIFKGAIEIAEKLKNETINCLKE